MDAQTVHRVLSHPFRGDLIRAFEEPGTETMASVDYVERFGVPGKEKPEAVSWVAYHMRQLAELGVIDHVRTEKRRGANKQVYRLNDAYRGGLLRDALALDEIAILLEGNLDHKLGGLVARIAEIVTSTGRMSEL